MLLFNGGCGADEGALLPSAKHGHPRIHLRSPLFPWFFYGYLFLWRVFPLDKPKSSGLGWGGRGRQGDESEGAHVQTIPLEV